MPCLPGTSTHPRSARCPRAVKGGLQSVVLAPPRTDAHFVIHRQVIHASTSIATTNVAPSIVGYGNVNTHLYD